MPRGSGRDSLTTRAGALREHRLEVFPKIEVPATRRAILRSDVAPPDRTALVVVDVQRAFEDAGYWGPAEQPGVRGERRAADRGVAATPASPSSSCATTRRAGLAAAAGAAGNAFRPEVVRASRTCS